MDTDAIAAKVKPEFAAKDKAKAEKKLPVKAILQRRAAPRRKPQSPVRMEGPGFIRGFSFPVPGEHSSISPAPSSRLLPASLAGCAAERRSPFLYLSPPTCDAGDKNAAYP